MYLRTNILSFDHGRYQVYLRTNILSFDHGRYQVYLRTNILSFDHGRYQVYLRTKIIQKLLQKSSTTRDFDDVFKNDDISKQNVSVKTSVTL